CRLLFFFSSRRRHTRFSRDWSSDVCSSDLRKDHKPNEGHCGRTPLRSVCRPRSPDGYHSAAKHRHYRRHCPGAWRAMSSQWNSSVRRHHWSGGLHVVLPVKEPRLLRRRRSHVDQRRYARRKVTHDSEPWTKGQVSTRPCRREQQARYTTGRRVKSKTRAL